MLLTVSGRWLYTNAAPVMPALQSYWLPIHVSVVGPGSGVFLVAGIASILFLLRTSPLGDPGDPANVDSRPARVVQRLPDAQTLDRIAYRTTVSRFRVRFWGNFRCDLGRRSLGQVLGLGCQGDRVFRGMGDLWPYLHARSTRGMASTDMDQLWAARRWATPAKCPDHCPAQALADPSKRSEWRRREWTPTTRAFRARRGKRQRPDPQPEIEMGVSVSPLGVSAFGQPSVAAGRIFRRLRYRLRLLPGYETGCVVSWCRAKATQCAPQWPSATPGARLIPLRRIFRRHAGDAYALDAASELCLDQASGGSFRTRVTARPPLRRPLVRSRLDFRRFFGIHARLSSALSAAASWR